MTRDLKKLQHIQITNPSSNSLGVGSENAAYSQLDLMGYTLTRSWYIG